MARARPGRPDCQVCGGTGIAQAKAMGGVLNGTFHVAPCFECFPRPIVSVGTEDPGAFTAEEWRRAQNRREFLDTLVEDAAFLDAGVRLRAALDAVRAARQDGEA